MPNKPSIHVVSHVKSRQSLFESVLNPNEVNIQFYASIAAFIKNYNLTLTGCIILDGFEKSINNMSLHQQLVVRGLNMPIIFVAHDLLKSDILSFIKPVLFDAITDSQIKKHIFSSIKSAIEQVVKPVTCSFNKSEIDLQLYAEDIVKTAPVPLIVLNLESEVVAVNQHASNLFAIPLTPSPLDAYLRFNEVFGYVPQLKLFLNEVVSDGRDLEKYEVTQYFRNDIKMTLAFSARQLQDNSGNHNCILLLIEDITERKLAEKALFKEKTRAMVTLFSIGEAVITTDKAGFIEFINPIAEQLTGWRLREIKQKPISQILHLECEHTHNKIQDPVQDCLMQSKNINLCGTVALLDRELKRTAIELTASPMHDARKNVSGAVVVFKDVSEQRIMHKKMQYQATHDSLTDLVNRREFEIRLQQVLKSYHSTTQQHIICYLDLDQFKLVNDIAGHKAGDELLKQVTSIITETLRDRDTLARIGGDEFGLIMENCPISKAEEIINEIISEVHDYRFIWNNELFRVGLSVGIVPCSEHIKTSEQLLVLADVACYTAKELGRNQSFTYQPKANNQLQNYTDISRAASINSALDEDKFTLYCQPIYSIQDDVKRISEYEVLVRLKDDNGELLLPGAFIPAAERFGLMQRVDRWIIESTFKTYVDGNGEKNNIRIAINLSGNSLNDESLLEFINSQFKKYQLNPNRVCFEVTETAAIHNIKHAKTIITALKQKGCRFSLDDFGSGLSSFSYLQNLPIDTIKIDGGFVREIVDNKIDHAMVEAINTIGHTMGLGIVAEYAETENIIRELKEIGVDFAQGYGLHKPIEFSSIFT